MYSFIQLSTPEQRQVNKLVKDVCQTIASVAIQLVTDSGKVFQIKSNAVDAVGNTTYRRHKRRVVPLLELSCYIC